MPHWKCTFYRHSVTLGIMAASILFASTDAPARPRPPLPPFPEFAGPVLFHESFDWGYSAGLTNDEVVIANYGTLRGSWTGMALERSGQVTPFIVPALAPDGQTNVASLTESAARFWLTPYWASPGAGGVGPGKEAALLELVATDGQNAATIWSLRATPDGSALMLLAIGKAGPVELLRANIAWTSTAHCLALNFGPDGTALFVDGALAAKGAATLPVPPKAAGLAFGSTWTGDLAAEADLDEIYIFGRPLSEAAMAFYYSSQAPQAALGPVSEAEWQARQEAIAKRKSEQSGGGQMMTMDSSAPPVPGGGGGGTNCPCNTLTNFTVGYQSSTNVLALGIAATTNPWIALTILTTNTSASVDMFGTTNLVGLALPSLSRTNWTWLTRVRGGTTNFSWGVTNWCERYFLLGTRQDSDNDGLTDAYENLTSHTATNSANSPRTIYEAAIASQNPNNWFKLNDGSLTNAISGQPAVTNNATWDVDAFATASNSITFNGTNQRMTAGDVISGGTGTNQGSLSLLFRSLPSHPTNNLTTPRYVLCQSGSTTNEFGLFFQPTNATPDSGSLKLQIGGQTNILLTSNAIVFGTWYYLALTWNESNHLAAWYLAPIGGTLISSNFDFGTTNVVGNSSIVAFGNRQNSPGNSAANYTNAFRIPPGNGALDQLAFWNRELTSAEVNAQFHTLDALFQGPAKAFDLRRWNILLPVDNTNGLNPSNLALEIGTGWLNSGFKYVDPSDWTQKYFYLSTTNTIVFEAPWNGARSANGSGARSELRGTNPDGSKDNWFPLGTNTLEATCSVISAGTNNDRKVIMGQIHSETATDPPVVISYNHPSFKNLTATYKSSPSGGADNNLLLATNVNVLDQIHYQVQLRDNGTTLKVHVEASVNGVPQTAQDQQDATLTAYSSWQTNTFYFKAGCYYPTNGSGSPIAGTAKVVFSSLKATRQP